MLIKDLFLKPIDRDIEGVIKADDLESLKTEVEEYVITNEISRNLGVLMEQYNKSNQSNIGVWISGFFGSGKSHLLKMLALLLEKRQINGLNVFETLLAKVPPSDAMLKAELKKAVAIPSCSILFNIDQKADTVNKANADAVLGVFARVFDEFCGYFGQQGYIAKFERDLDKASVFQAFKDNFAQIAGISWHEGREAYNTYRLKISEAYAAVTGNSTVSAQDIIMSYRQDYSLSIEDFANNVNSYIQAQPKGFRLNFYVDEVGQYVADNIKLMTNLQTISESLATKCNGQAWLFVTSQEDINTVLGDVSQRMGNDFTKIQARFATRMHLSSQDVAEVIQKRLLAKTEAGASDCRKRYAMENQNFGTLFTFPDGGMSFHNFRDEEEFVDSYPFIPYQYGLFQQAIEMLSKHNAFTGRHNSVGERSMLGVFQDVAKAIGKQETGSLGSFDLMFEGIRNSLVSGILRAILTAEQNLDNPFAVRLLKTLFMVKYVKSFRATVRNLRVLMQTRFDEDIKGLENKIIDALGVLEKQTYIQRNDDLYEYLTNEEQDVEAEIKDELVEHEEVLKTLEDLFFADIIRDSKIRYEENQQDYAFAKAIDEKPRGRERELRIDFITSFSEFNDNLVALKAHSMDKAELLVVLPPDDQFRQDLLMFKKTESYIKQNQGTHAGDVKNTILTNKAFQNSERKKAIMRRVSELLSKAKFIVSGDEAEVSGEDARSRIVKAFNLLIARVYPNLRMLGKTEYNEKDIAHYLNANLAGLFNQGILPMNEAEQEMLTFIRNNHASGERATMKKIEEHFSTRPFGWYLAAIQCIAAMLAGRDVLDCWLNGTLLESSALAKALQNTQNFSSLILDPKKLVDPNKVKALKDFSADFFNEPVTENDPRILVKQIKEKLGNLITQLEGFLQLQDRYPFMSMLKPVTTQLNAFKGREYEFLISDEARREMDSLLDLKDEAIDPLIGFMSSAKKEIYDQLAAFALTKKPDLPQEDQQTLQDYLDDPRIYQGNLLQVAKVDLEDIKKRLEKRLEQERDNALQNISRLQVEMHQMAGYQALKAEEQQNLDASFGQIEYTIKQQSLAVSIRDKAGNYEVREYPDLLTRMGQMVAAKKGDDQPGEPLIPQPTFTHITHVSVPFELKILADEAGVRAYCEALQQALLAAISQHKHIKL